MSKQLTRKQSVIRKGAIVLNLIFIYQICFPTISLALTSGPVTPEFSQFEPVATTNMVNLFSGDATYNLPVINIPGANGGGYQMSLSYHSGTNPEEEASWVGYGWTLNPGAITRSKRGLPDDWNGGEKVKFWNKAPANQTVSVGGSVSAEVTSIDIPVSLNASLRYNNYKGFGYNVGAGVSDPRGIFSLGYNVSDGEGSFSLRVNPLGILSKKKELSANKKDIDAQDASLKNEKDPEKIKTGKENKKKLESARKELQRSGSNQLAGSGIGSLNLVGGAYGMFSYASSGKPSNVSGFEGNSVSVNASGMAAVLPFNIGATFGISGSYTIQKNVEFDELDAYGYMYNSNATSDNAMMDYSVEKGSDYNKNDVFLGIPFNNADNFSLSGEGLGGGFRMYNISAGHYKPNAKKSETNLFNIGVDFTAGFANGGGGEGGGGESVMEVEEWKKNSSDNKSRFAAESDPESNFFRFNNDMGGWLIYGDESKSLVENEKEQQASIDKDHWLPGAKTMYVDHSAIKTTLLENYGEKRNGRSSYIGYSKNKDFTVTANSKKYRVYEKDNTAASKVSRTASNKIANQVGEFSVVNENGQRYNYGLPVYSRNEKNMQFDVKGSLIDHKYLAYKNISNYNDLETVQGEERLAPYASTFLLTSINDADYIDRTSDGPSEDDFGGYTKFSYQRAHGGDDKENSAAASWYKFRMPYSGLSYAKNEMSNEKDDMGSVNEGERETYYLERIETKTHVALFITSDRNDGYDAEHDAALASANKNAKGLNKLKKLDRIELYLKKDLNASYQPISGAKPLKVVNFQYDYSLVKGIPNGAAVPNGEAETGKLTLRKMWFDYEGTYNAKISPYEFDYQYPTTDYPSTYDAFENFRVGKTENPDYDEFNLDAWGNYQANGSARFDNMRTWLNQAAAPASFDPAAWQLKRIKLPSGGEIHIQYEQDDYQYVQDKVAHAMVNLTGYDDNAATYTFNAGTVGIATETDAELLRKSIEDLYEIKGNRMYFKFLYKLMGNSNPLLDQCNVEYLTGYCKVYNVERTGLNITLTLKGSSGGHDRPLKVCKEYVKTQKAGLVNVASGCVDDFLEPYATTFSENSSIEIVKSFINKAKDFKTNITVPNVSNDPCGAINPDLSYLRIPMIKPKKGGGIRVKRILMYDPGIRTGAPELYGSEYVYTTKDQNGRIISSGVATNEPASIREENILTDFIARKDQSLFDKIVSGDDKKKVEGPLGESIMPGPSVGYSKVIVKNIHSGQTNTGFMVNEFYTAKDFPFEYLKTGINEESDFLPMPLGLVNRFVNNVWLTQGYSFWINNMHGQQKRIATYAGTYNDDEIHNPNASTLVSAQEFTYFGKNEELPVLTSLNNIDYHPLGREMDLTFESRAVKDNTTDGGVEFDFDIGVFGILPVPEGPVIIPSVTMNQSEMRSHVTCKVINWPAVQKSVRSFADGVWSETANLAFSPFNGQPIVTRTFDGYNGLQIASQTHNGTYTSYSIPAGFEYENFKGQYLNEKKIISAASYAGVAMDKNIEGTNVYLDFSSASGEVCDAVKNFVRGDLIKLSSGASDIYHVDEIKGNRIKLLPTSYGATGNSATDVSIEILRSGRNNMLAQTIGSFTTYGDISVLPSIDETLDAASQTELNRRNAFASQLNAIRNGGMLNGSQIASNLLLDPVNVGCWANPQNITVTNPTTNTIGISIGNSGIREDDGGYSSTNLHPMVAQLNDLLNSIWGKKMTGKVDYVNGGIPYAGGHLVDNANLNIRSIITDKLNISYVGINGSSSAIYLKDFIQFPTFGPIGFSIVGKRAEGFRCSSFTMNFMSGSTISGQLEAGVGFSPPAMNGDYPINVLWRFEANNCETVLGKGVKGTTSQTELKKFFATDASGNIIEGQFTNKIGYFKQLPRSGGKVGSDLYFHDILTNCDSKFPVSFYSVVSVPYLSQCDLKKSNISEPFKVDVKTGALLYFSSNNDCGTPVDCIQFCTPFNPKKVISNVVAATAQTFSDDWDNVLASQDVYVGYQSAYETGKKGKWRATTSYSYRATVSDALQAAFNPTVATLTDKTWAHNSGRFSMDMFNWQSPGANDPTKWLPLNTVTKYSPDGQPVEEQNILGIKSAAKFGYGRMLPYLIAKNADNQSVQFESFENTYYNPGGGVMLEDNVSIGSTSTTIKADIGHSGKQCLNPLKFKDNKFYTFKPYILTQQFKDKGAQIKFWAKGQALSQDFKLQYVVKKTGTATKTYTVTFNQAARTGEWSLLEANAAFSSQDLIGSEVTTQLIYSPSGSPLVIYIDDVRLQPMDAEMACYVYDNKNFRVLASFDDQHFGVYYVYDKEGKLVRKQIETERGIKTVTETQYNTPAQNRNTVISGQ